MNINMLLDVSMNGRMAYAIMCIEKYLVNKYPNKDWTKLSQLMWEATSSYWDTWDNKYIEIIPEYLFEFSNYEDSDFESLTKEDYDYYVSLFEGISDGSEDDELNVVLSTLHSLQEVYCYSDIPNEGKESLDIIESLCRVLENESVELPNPDLVKFSSFEEKDGWGEQFDGAKLSIIVK